MEKPGISLEELLYQSFPSNEINKLPDYKENNEVTTNVAEIQNNSTINNRLGGEEDEQTTIAMVDATCSRVGEKVRGFYKVSGIHYLNYFGFLVLQT